MIQAHHTTMAVLDRFSCECLKSELDIFSVSPTQTSIEQTVYKKYRPISAVTGQSPLEFYIPATDEDYLDLQQSYLYLRTRIQDAHGNNLQPPDGNDDPADDTFVFPINYFVNTQFKNVDVYLSGTQVSPNDNLYAYRAYLETLLSYGRDAKEGPLQACFYYPDTREPNLHDKTVAAAECVNKGARSRFNRTRYSQGIELIGRIHNPLFNQHKLMLNKMDIRMKFNRHDSKFPLIAFLERTNYTIAIDEAILYVCHKTISPSVREAHENGLLKSNAKYPIRTSEMKFFTKAAGHADLSEPNLCSGILPRRVVVGLVRSEGFNGSHHYNPLDFASHHLRSIQLRRNGIALPFEEIEVDFEGNNVVQGYVSLFQGTNRLFRDNGISVGLLDYTRSGNSLYVFDLSQDGQDGNLSLLQEGTISLNIKLDEALQYSVTIVVYIEKEGLVEIDRDRNVTFES